MKVLTLIISFLTVVLLTGVPFAAGQECGDVYPDESFPGAMDCGNGTVDIFDMLEVVDIIVGKVIASDCQKLNGSVPNGLPPTCGNPSNTPNCEVDENIDIFDLLVIIDKSLKKPNCCDYCFPEIECVNDEDCDDDNGCTDDSCTANVCNNICNAKSPDDPCCVDPECYGEYVCGGTASCTITPEDSWASFIGDGFEVDLCLDNQNDTVRSVQLDVREEIDGAPVNCVECVGCQVTGRTIDFACSVSELPNGFCRVVLYNTGSAVINPGVCSIVKVFYDAKADYPFTKCITLYPLNVLMASIDNTEIDSAGLIGDVCFTDFDGDGIPNDEDECPADPENDVDEDAVCGDVDNCPEVYNPDQGDYDNDGVGDVCDSCTDSDGDGYGNPGFPFNTCSLDNCPDDYNISQEDFDEDGMGDVCDPDDDNDGILDDEDECPYDPENDVDEDGVCGNNDDCPATPDGYLKGTCIDSFCRLVMGSTTTCLDDSECGGNKTCQLTQGDFNGNGIGDVCECYADVNCDSKVDLTDLVVMRQQFLSPDCETSFCQADCNADNEVNLCDVSIMKRQFLRGGCPP